MRIATRFAFALSALALGCEKPPASPIAASPAIAPAAPIAAPAAPATSFNRLERKAFNRRAVELNLPLFWRADDDGDRELDASELSVVWASKPAALSDYVTEKGELTPLFREAYERMLETPDEQALSAEERKRREAVRRELGQGRPTLVESDFSKASDVDRAFVGRMLEVARWIERLYQKQRGTAGLEDQIPSDDPASAALFFRNQGPFCEAPKTEKDPDCRALPKPVERIVGLYPADLQKDPKFCERLERAPNARELMGHFSTVVAGAKPNTFAALPYSKAFPEETSAVAELLEAAARELGSDEAALVKYLNAAALGFRNDDWEPANEAWVAMSPHDSKYYLRVGPDEVYYEPCAWKAGFALTFARVNSDSLTWQARLDPIKQELENEMAALSGKPYRARQVKFKLPDFIDIILNAGDSRGALGATIGQSLPNWGEVAKRGGRTVTMTNIAIDADSQAQQRESMSSLFCGATMAKASTDPKVMLLSIVLHEAAHNLGPSGEYAVNGKVAEQAFGGGLAATLEELKAQTASLYFPKRLLERGLIPAEETERSYIQEVAWAFGHIAQGMYDAAGQPRHYSQLASIQLGALTKAGAVTWKPGERAANGSDSGCFELDFARFPEAAGALLQQVLQIKARGERAAGEKLRAEWVDGEGPWKATRAVIAERWLRAPKASYVYSIRGALR
ncbi:MAG: hypothetical protein M3020_06430 [Myxococcota bacterium]|nr:hypothetical protein [Myxococcota bacterium]